jgi:lactoylglutathione lyase
LRRTASFFKETFLVTIGINHLGLTVRDLDQTTAFFTDCLGWALLARDDSYPRTTVSDGTCRLTLWQADRARAMTGFDRKTNIGLHHLALEVPSRDALDELAAKVRNWPGVQMEFNPEPMGTGPRMHTMFSEPGGIRLEIIWPAS